jgi:glycosyltransferase involved in cell wall biosynthesis
VRGAGGGPDKTILLSAAPLRSTAYGVSAAFLHAPRDPGWEVLRRRAAIHDCPLIDVPDRGPLDPSVPARLLRICRQRNVRIWHGHDYKTNALGLFLRPFHPMKLVTTLHGWVQHTARTPLYYAIDRLCIERYDHAISVCADLDEALARRGVPEERRSLLPNGVDERAFRRRAAPAAAALRRSVPEGRLVLAAVGRLSAEKGFDLLVRAMASLRAAGADVELWIAGEGDGRGELQARIDGCGLAGRVKLLGFVEDVSQVFEASDAFALSSLREGLPNVLLEAMAMEVPVVAAAVGGVAAVVRDGENGLLCAPRDADALAQGLVRLHTDDALRRRLASAARRTVEERFTFGARAAAERRIYDRVLGRV